MFNLRRFSFALGLGAVALGLAACSSGPGPAWTFAPSAERPLTAPVAVQHPHTAAAAAEPLAFAPRPAPAAIATVIHQDITIVTGDMIGKTEYPAYVPSRITLPAHATVLVTITNFDDATPLPKGSEQYAKASGIAGAVADQPIDLTDPNGAKGKASTYTSLNPADVSHTFTIPGLGINVPIAAHARVSFLLKTGDAGTYTFRCFDPCGAGPTGWGTAMAAERYMEGTITIA